jgi:centrosomal CEP104-like protein
LNKRQSKFAMVFRTKTGMDPSRVSRPPDEERASESPGRSNIPQYRDCEYCCELVPVFDYQEHLRDACPENPSYGTCERCGLRTIGSHYNQHVKRNTCRSPADIARTQARESRLEQARKKKRDAKVGFIECGTLEIGSEYFQRLFGIASRAYSQRLQIERDSQDESFDVDSFWADDAIAEEMICAMTKRVKLKPGTNEPVLRKGRPVFVRSGASRRLVALAVSIVRRGVRSVRALQALCRKSNSIAHAVKQADQLGSILRMIAPLRACGLCANNADANKAKDAAIEGWENGGKVPASSARKALIASLYGSPVTLAQVDFLEAALSAWEDSRRTRKRLRDN